MPHTRSAKKRLRQNVGRRLRNKAVKTHLRTRHKKFNAAVTGGQLEEAAKQGLLLQKSCDHAVSKGVIHGNKASRMKSSAARKLNMLRSAGPTT